MQRFLLDVCHASFDEPDVGFPEVRVYLALIHCRLSLVAAWVWAVLNHVIVRASILPTDKATLGIAT